ncbi:pantoate--beta-alanine ligase [Thioalkalivibrio paradoxus]|uniref:Pantothenate synthetase n=1 Tax=Thioalkalivibrio paradoxus ARh 1 TaxID=713585 RepID=W0DKZ1_9GAMM|nr:pantoate--beta-alanine ligase [Thioalkalivibrio paradoxus]AHE99126.1 pantoate--beta-alanine ligase [Thioalkalivibrio paradoxus ARh 1]
MRIVYDRRQVAALCREWRRRDSQVLAFVPTMGNLHAGHLALVRHARERGDRVLVSVFVNPMQFDRSDDLERYPRTLDADAKKLAEAGVDALFCPEPAEMYPQGHPPARVTVPQLSGILEGASRPGHFDGVATVVAKLFNLVQPDVAVFGEKDHQQLKLIEAMVAALNFPVLIDAVPTVREPDGLALSSRNGQLSESARGRAPELYRSLQEAAAVCLEAPDRWPAVFAEATAQARERLREAGFEPDYVEVRRRSDLQEPAADDRELILLAAAWLDGTRLIDNLRL